MVLTHVGIRGEAFPCFARDTKRVFLSHFHQGLAPDHGGHSAFAGSHGSKSPCQSTIRIDSASITPPLGLVSADPCLISRPREVVARHM